MTQDEIDRAERENPANWSDILVGVYFSKRDSRTWVRKRPPGIGWTLDLGAPIRGVVAGGADRRPAAADAAAGPAGSVARQPPLVTMLPFDSSAPEPAGGKLTPS